MKTAGRDRPRRPSVTDLITRPNRWAKPPACRYLREGESGSSAPADRCELQQLPEGAGLPRGHEELTKDFIRNRPRTSNSCSMATDRWRRAGRDHGLTRRVGNFAKVTEPDCEVVPEQPAKWADRVMDPLPCAGHLKIRLHRPARPVCGQPPNSVATRKATLIGNNDSELACAIRKRTHHATTLSLLMP